MHSLSRLAAALVLVLAPLSGFGAGQNYDVKIEGMHCDSCSKAVKAALGKLPDVEPGSVTVILQEKRAVVAVQEGKAVPKAEIEKAVSRLGYKVTSVEIAKDAPAKAKN